jgi:hypothetical protein
LIKATIAPPASGTIAEASPLCDAAFTPAVADRPECPLRIPSTEHE